LPVVDDRGHFYALVSQDSHEIAGEWHGEAIAEPNPAGKITWLEFGSAGPDAPARLILPPAAQLPVGKGDPPWPTPAECYLAALAPVTCVSINEAVAGPEDTAEIVAAVADGLIAVGALLVTSPLLCHAGRDQARWQKALMERWGRRARQRAARAGSTRRLALAVRLPLERGTAVIEGVSRQGDLVTFQLYGHPWVMGEYWPLITPCFEMRATDDAGEEHKGIPGSWQGSATNEGSGGFWFWPPIDQDRKSLRVTVSTLWEAAWADIELPAG
jgi:hypothetical protein